MTTFKSWQEVGDWYAGLEKDRVVPNAAVREKAQQIIAGKKTDEEKAQALYDFVSKQFRYVSLSFGVGRYQPHSASEVLANAYGDCKDKHTLFASMLDAVGIKSHAILINSSRKLDPDVPSPAQFDHVITWIAFPNAPAIVDVTEEVAPYRLIASVLRNKGALMVMAASKSELITTPAKAPFEQSDVFALRGKVSDIGKLEGSVHVEMRGDSELAMRMAFRSLPQARWPFIAQYVDNLIGINGEVTDIDISPITDTSKPFTIDWKFSATNYIDWTNKTVQLKLPFSPMSLPEFPDGEDAANAKPLELTQAPLVSDSTIEIDLPARYEVRLPVAVALTRSYGAYRSTYSADKNHITAKRELKLSEPSLPQERRADYEAFKRGAEADEAQKLSLESSSATGADVPEGMNADDLNDAANSALQHGNYKESVKLFQKVVQLEPQHKTAWNNLGRAYLGDFEIAKAEEAFRKQIAINPYDEYAYNNLGMALEREDKLEDAIAQYKKQIEVSPLDAYSHANLGRLLVGEHRYADAVPELETAITISPKAAMLYPILGSAYAETGKTDKAEQTFDKAVQIDSNHMVWNQVAYEMSLHGVNLTKARSYAQSAVASSESGLRNIDIDHVTEQDIFNTASVAAEWDTLGWIYFKQNDTAKAQQYIEASWQLAQHAEVGDHLAQIYERTASSKAQHMYALSAAAYSPTPDVHAHLLKAYGSEDKAQKASAEAKKDLEQIRTIKVDTKSQYEGTGDFFLLIDNTGKVQRAKLASGSETLIPFGNSLAGLELGPRSPDASDAEFLRRATAECSKTKPQCTLTIIPLERTTLN